MSDLSNSDEAKYRKSTFPFLLLPVAAGLAGNYFRFQLFLNTDFLFGSIFAMPALQFIGLGGVFLRLPLYLNLGDLGLCRDVARIFFDHGPECRRTVIVRP
jgi:hypothetical protein